MKKYFYLFTIVVLYSHCKKPCIESRGVEGAGLTIIFFDTQRNEYFYPENTVAYPMPYKLDSLKVTDSKGNILRTPSQLNISPSNQLKKIYEIGITPIFIPQDDAVAYNQEMTKFIYIKYNYNTYDTLKLTYKTIKEKCANKYEYVKAYYKNNLIAQATNSYSEGLIFTLNH